MKCIQCGHHLPSDSKFCIACGAKQENKCNKCGTSLTEGARFCGECGTPVTLESSNVSTDLCLKALPLSPLPQLGLIPITIGITDISGTDAQDENCLHVAVKYSITNDSSEDWDCIDIKSQIFSATGQVIDETRDSINQTLSAGDTEEYELNFWGVNSSDFGNDLHQAHVVISGTACRVQQVALGTSTIPKKTSNSTLLLAKAANLSNVLQVVGGNVSKTEADDDGECRIIVKSSVQGLTNLHLPLIRLSAKVTDKLGREVIDAEGDGELAPAGIILLSGNAYVEEKLLANANVDLVLSAYVPIGMSMAQRCGMRITAAENDDNDNCDENFENQDSGEFDELSDVVTIRFAMTKGEGEWPQLANLSEAEKKNPTLFSSFQLCWDPESCEELEDVTIDRCEVIYDGVSYLESTNSGLHVSHQELEGYPAPVIRFYLSKPVIPSAFCRAVWSSSYLLLPESQRAADSGFYCEDHNGYTQVLDENQINDIIVAIEEAGLTFGKIFFGDALQESISATEMKP